MSKNVFNATLVRRLIPITYVLMCLCAVGMFVNGVRIDLLFGDGTTFQRGPSGYSGIWLEAFIVMLVAWLCLFRLHLKLRDRE